MKKTATITLRMSAELKESITKKWGKNSARKIRELILKELVC